MLISMLTVVADFLSLSVLLLWINLLIYYHHFDDKQQEVL